jgi:hypothetical protein
MVAGVGVDGVDGGPGGGAGDVEGAGRRPGEGGWFGDELVLGDDDVFVMAGALPGPAEDLVAGLPEGDVGSEFGDGAG